ncbi:hypothetical protein A8B77_05395 [Erythrobacter sp. EhN03]|nr:hypothetical protein A3719_03500 [Erythrobacter sp. HI0020]KZY13862.1 hypothetical protein A3726_21050 [Erythrobacter sp. HI0037]KZY20572.1 hypothetical protein A3727_02290 [Erythrobacter sp. HI0038]OAN83673.1 hypothetical protein A8B77_05395 [Erythrobacter sp. EhN03]KZY18764.1 hypothetical protein A3726_35600 [Erythrobacter sp. HI0037]
MVNGRFTFSVSFAAHFAKGVEAGLHPFELFAQITSRSEFRDQISPAKLPQIRAVARFSNGFFFRASLKHALWITDPW